MLRVLNQHAPSFKGHKHPFMRINHYRVGSFNPVKQVSHSFYHGSGPSVGRIYMIPKIMFFTDFCDCVQVIDRAGIGRPCHTDSADWMKAVLLIHLDSLVKRFDADPLLIVYRNFAQILLAKAEHVDRLIKTRMTLS